MLMRIVTIYDVKAEAHTQPMFFQSLAQAERSFRDICNDKDHSIGKHPEDYIMYWVADWDECAGSIVSLKEKVAVAEGNSMIKSIIKQEMGN